MFLKFWDDKKSRELIELRNRVDSLVHIKDDLIVKNHKLTNMLEITEFDVKSISFDLDLYVLESAKIPNMCYLDYCAKGETAHVSERCPKICPKYNKQK
jgi:hypothetical protein